MSAPILVTVVGGYLGAGKTTLVNHILRNADERVAVLVNDFGSINIDADLIESEDGSTISLANGCICCSLVDGFGAALESVQSIEPVPERLVIEASGVANPAQVAAYAHGPGLLLDAVVTVVDADQIRMQARNEYLSDVVEQQVAAADVLVLNKCDLLSGLEVDRVVSWLGESSGAVLVRSVRGEVALSVLLGVEVVGDRSISGAPAPPFESWTETFDEPLDRARIEALLDAGTPGLVRVKGIVRFKDSPSRRHVVQLVGQRWSVTESGDWTEGPSTLVFIATNGPFVDARKPNQ